MNQSYRVLWSSVRKCFVVVNEKAKSKGKPSASRKAIAAAVASLFVVPSVASAACPDNPTLTTAVTDSQCYSNTNISISSTGSIDVAGGAMVPGAVIFAAPYTRTMVNNGSIKAAASASDASVVSEFDYAYAYAYAYAASAVGVMFIDGLDGSFSNTGLVSAQAASVTKATSTANHDDDYAYAYAYAYMSGAYAAGVAINNDFSGRFDNTGTINASASASASAKATVADADSIGDYGVAYSVARTYATAYGVYMNQYMTGGAVFNNRGTINASSSVTATSNASTPAEDYTYAYAYSGAGAYAVAYGMSVGGMTEGEINNFGTINVSATSDATSSAATFAEDAGSQTRAYGDTNAIGIIVERGVFGGSALNNHGTIQAAATGTANGSATGNGNEVRVSAGADGDADGIFLGGIYDGFRTISLDGSLLNAGTIKATGNGIGNANADISSDYEYAYVYADVFAGGDSDVTGIYLSGYFDSGASLVNSGNITANANAASNSIAKVAVSEDYAFAYAYSGASASADAIGITAYGLNDDAVLTNRGSINVAAQAKPRANAVASADSPDSDAYAYAETRAYARAYGIFLRAFSSPVINEGASVNNYGNINVVANASPVTNATGIGDNAYSDAYAFAYAFASGIKMRGSMASGALLNNAGTINVTVNATAAADGDYSYAYAYAYAYGVVLTGSVDSGAIIKNSGAINVVANADAGAAFGIYLPGNLNGEIINSGTISAKGLGGVSPSAVYSVYASGGSGNITNMTGGLLDGQIYAGGNISVTNAGIINTHMQGSYIGGDYTQKATGALTIAAIDTMNYGGLYTNGTATLAAGSGIRVALDSRHTLGAGDTLTNVIVAGNALNMSTLNVLDNTLAFNFDATNNGSNGVDLTASSTGLTTVAAAVQSTGLSSANGVAGALDKLLVSINDQPLDLSNYLFELGGLETQKDVADKVSQLLPLISGGLTQTTLNTMHSSSRVVQERQDANAGRSSGDPLLTDKHFWFKPFGSWTNQDDRSGTSGYDARTYGLVFGADGELSEANRIGAAFSYARSDVDGNSSAADQGAEVKTYQGIVYGSHALSSVTDINYQFDIGFHDNNGRRDIAGVGTARSDFDSWSLHAGVGLAHIINVNEKTNFVPSIRTDYSWIYDEGYEEKGAGALNLDVENNKTDELVLSIDGKLIHAISETAVVTANFGVGYDLINDRASLTSAFAGAPNVAFTTKGIDPSPWLARGGLGVVINSTETVELSAKYDFEVREDFDNQTASFKVRWAF